MKYTNSELILASETDAKINLSLVGCVNIIQDNICCFFEKLGIDQVTMKSKYGCVWVFAKNKFEIYDKIVWNDKVKIECFISSKSAVRMVVDTVFKNEEDKILLYSKIETCLLDYNQNKIRKITDDMFLKNVEVFESLKDFTFQKFLSNNDYSICGEVVVRSNNIDYCHHTNNVEYTRFIMSTYSLDEILRYNITEFEIQYLAQTRENDKLKILKFSENNIDNFIIKSDETNVVKCKIIKENIAKS